MRKAPLSSRFTRAVSIVLLALMPLLYLSALSTVSTTSCTGLGTRATEYVKEKTADISEAKAVKIGIDLKKDYDIDISKDTPQASIMKIVKKEIQAGNGDLAMLLSDVEKVTTLSEALQVVVTHHQILTDKAKRGEVQKEAVDAAQKTSTALASLAGLFGLTSVAGFLRGNGFKNAALLVMKHVEDARIKDRSADDIVDKLKEVNGTDKKAAMTIANLARDHFPESTDMKKAQYQAAALAKKVATQTAALVAATQKT
jgi:hypothetical protein